MIYTYTIERLGQPIEQGKTNNYKSLDTFENYTIHAFNRAKVHPLRQAYLDGARIKLFADNGELVKTYYLVNTIFLDKWDNYPDAHPARMQGINLALDMLQKYDAIRINFNYEGRTRHELAAQRFKMRMHHMNVAKDYDFEVEYNYHFEIKRKVSLFDLTPTN